MEKTASFAAHIFFLLIYARKSGDSHAKVIFTEFAPPFGIACAVYGECRFDCVNLVAHVGLSEGSAALQCKALGFSPIIRDSVFTDLDDSIRRKLLSEGYLP